MFVFDVIFFWFFHFSLFGWCVIERNIKVLFNANLQWCLTVTKSTFNFQLNFKLTNKMTVFFLCVENFHFQLETVILCFIAFGRITVYDCCHCCKKRMQIFCKKYKKKDAKTKKLLFLTVYFTQSVSFSFLWKDKSVFFFANFHFLHMNSR